MSFTHGFMFELGRAAVGLLGLVFFLVLFGLVLLVIEKTHDNGPKSRHHRPRG